MVLASSSNETEMQACDVCEASKPLTDFSLDYGRYRRNTCKHCRNQNRISLTRKQRAINKEIYGRTRTPEEAEKERVKALIRWQRIRQDNISRYGSPLSPQQKEQMRIRNEKVRSENLELYGFSSAPKEREASRQRATVRRDRNRELYGSVRSPEDKVRVNSRFRQKYKATRQMLIELHGGRCACCGTEKPALLTFDHINGGGRSRDVGGDLINALWKEVRKTGVANSEYRILCWNCNSSLGIFGYCPHNSEPAHIMLAKVNRNKENNAEYLRQYRRARKLEMIKAYGGKCRLCSEEHPEFLTIDHVNGNGRQHRKQIGYIGGADFYAWLRRQGYPRDDFQLLCFNCNCSKGGN